MASFLFSDFFNDAGAWTTQNPDHLNTLVPLVGNAAAADRNVCSRTIVNMSEHAPTLVAFIDSRDPENISFAHSPVFYPNHPTHNSAYNDHIVLTMGNDGSRAISVAVPTLAFARAANIRCLRLPQAAAQLVAAPAVVNQGPHAGTAAHTDVIEVRRALLMPPADIPRILTEAPLGAMTKAAFYQRFIQAGMTHTDADVVAIWTDIGLWFRAACTMANTGGADVNSLAVTPAMPANPADMFAVGAWCASRKEQLERRAGVGGPGLTTNAFNAGINNLQTTMNDVATQRLDFERARRTLLYREAWCRPGSTHAPLV